MMYLITPPNSYYLSLRYKKLDSFQEHYKEMLAPVETTVDELDTKYSSFTELSEHIHQIVADNLAEMDEKLEQTQNVLSSSRAEMGQSFLRYASEQREALLFASYLIVKILYLYQIALFREQLRIENPVFQEQLRMQDSLIKANKDIEKITVDNANRGLSNTYLTRSFTCTIFTSLICSLLQWRRIQTQPRSF